MERQMTLSPIFCAVSSIHFSNSGRIGSNSLNRFMPLSFRRSQPVASPVSGRQFPLAASRTPFAPPPSSTPAGAGSKCSGSQIASGSPGTRAGLIPCGNSPGTPPGRPTRRRSISPHAPRRPLRPASAILLWAKKSFLWSGRLCGPVPVKHVAIPAILVAHVLRVIARPAADMARDRFAVRGNRKKLSAGRRVRFARQISVRRQVLHQIVLEHQHLRRQQQQLHIFGISVNEGPREVL